MRWWLPHGHSTVVTSCTFSAQRIKNGIKMTFFTSQQFMLAVQGKTGLAVFKIQWIWRIVGSIGCSEYEYTKCQSQENRTTEKK